MNKDFLVVLTIGLMLCAICGTVSADTIVSTLPQTDSNTTGVGGTNDYAAGFIWASSSLFGYAELYLGVKGSPNATLSVAIYDDNSGTPGNLVQNLTGDNPTTAGLYTYSGTTALTQDDTYWLVLSTGIYGDFINEYIWYDGTLGDPNYVNTMWQRPTAYSWTTSDFVVPAAFSVNTAVSTPEPSILLLLSISLLGIAGATRWKLLK